MLEYRIKKKLILKLNQLQYKLDILHQIKRTTFLTQINSQMNSSNIIIDPDKNTTG